MGCSTEHHVNIEMSTCLVTECALRGDRYLSMVLWLGGAVAQDLTNAEWCQYGWLVTACALHG
ncbi:unnamed protein product [Linum tenue]|uniref:Uncharacterized protein n=1 Tax=Linum tenue TaxID=586396 RepID=A0AAV0KW05_9ROSI|nr:unnamed protein product [Linum tenue]